MSFLARTSTLIVTGILSLVFLTLIYLCLAIPLTGPLLDATWGYDYEFVTGTLQSYGTEGRDLYVLLSLTLDALLPLSYVALGVGLMHRLRPENKLLFAFPVATGCLDLLENVQIMAMMVQFPEISDVQVGFSSLTNQLKFALFWLTVVLIPIFVATKILGKSKQESR